MSLAEVLLIALSMAMDAFAVALGAATTGKAVGLRPTFRLSFHFGLFQFLMPLVGWLAGVTIEKYIARVDHWLAFGLLAFVGIRMIRAGLDPDGEASAADPTRGWMMVLLSIAVSLDALAVGLSLALIGVNIWYPAAVIGLVTGLMTWLGLRIGGRLGVAFGKRMGIAGGLVLIVIGLRVVLEHTLG